MLLWEGRQIEGRLGLLMVLHSVKGLVSLRAVTV